MGLSNIYYSAWLGGLVVNGRSDNTTITSTTIKDLAEQISWYPYHWQKDQLDQILSSDDPFAENDLIFGGRGDDFIASSSGNDRIFAGGGNDTVDGGTGTDWVFAGSGDDTGIFADTNTDGYDIYSGGRGYDTLVLTLSLEDYLKSKTEIESFNYNLDSFLKYIPFTFQNLGLIAHGWEELKVVVDPKIQSSDAVFISERPNVTGSPETVSTTGSLQFADDAFSNHTVSAELHGVSWSGGDLSAALVEQIALGFVADLGNVVDGEGAINWSFSIEDAQLDFLSADQQLEAVFQVGIDDGQAVDSEFVTVTISGANDAPIAQTITAVTDEDTGSVVLTPQFTDPDFGDVHSFSFEDFEASATTGLSDITDNGDGTFTYVASDTLDRLALGESETKTLFYSVSDSAGATSSASVIITIEGRNDDPMLQAGALAAAENGAAVDLDLSTLGSDIDSDDDGNSLIYSISGTPDKGQVNIIGTVLSFDPAGAFSHLEAGETEEVAIEVTATDAHGATAVNTISVTVTGAAGEPLFSPEDLSTGRIEYEFQGFDLETGEVKLPDFPGFPDIPGSDFTFTFNGNTPREGVNAVLFQNQTAENPVEIAFLDEISLSSLTQADVASAVFTPQLVDLPFESDDTILLKTGDGNIFAIGNSTEFDQPGDDFSVSFEYAQIGGTTTGPPLFSADDYTNGRVVFEEQGFDLETGTVKDADYPLQLNIPGTDFSFFYNGNQPPEGFNATLFQNQSAENPVQVAFIDEVDLDQLTQEDVDGASFTNDLVDVLLEDDDTILVKTGDGNVFAIGNAVEHDLPGEDNSVSFDYALVEGITPPPPDGVLSAEDLSTGELEFMFEGFDLETGTSQFGTFPFDFDFLDADFMFDYDQTTPSDGTNAIFVQNGSPLNEAQIAFFDETSLLNLTQAQIDSAVFSSEQLQQPFESDDTVLIKTWDGNVYALGNAVERDQPGGDYKVSFEYALIESDPSDPLFSPEDFSNGRIQFESQGFDLETGEVKDAQFPGDLNIPDSDFNFAYNGNPPRENTNAVLFQNQSPDNPVEIAFLDGIDLDELTQRDVDNAFFTTSLVSDLFEADDTVLLRTGDGNVFAIGNAVEYDLPGEDFTVSFDYAQINAPVSSDPVIAPEDLSSGRIGYEFEAFDLETGTKQHGTFPSDFDFSDNDFIFAYDSRPGAEGTNAAMLQSTSPLNEVQIAFIDEVDLDDLSQADLDAAVFTFDAIAEPFESDDTILVKTKEGNIFAVGNSVEHDLPGEDFSVSFDYTNLTDLF